MLKKLILSALTASGLAVAAVPAHAHGFVSFGIGVPGFVVAPAPIYGPPVPVYARPAPVYVAPPVYGVGFGPGYYYRGWHRGYWDHAYFGPARGVWGGHYRHWGYR